MQPVKELYMKVVIVGASGGCGEQLVTQAKERGHEVTAVVRSSKWRAPLGVKALLGELSDPTTLREAFRGQDVVVSALGLRLPGIAPWAKPEVPDLLTKSTPVLIEAMKAENLKRLIAISAGGVGDSNEKVPGVFRLFVKTTALRHAYAELEVMERLYLKSGLDVCICRPTGLTDGPKTGQAKVCSSFQGRATISRADVAAWMLDEIEKPSFAQKTPMISVTGIA
jgi:putative NADH-flavin reductase